MTDSINFQSNSRYEAYEDGSEYVVEDNFFSSDVVNKRGLNTQHAKYLDSAMSTLVDLQGDFESTVSSLEKQIADCDDPVVKQELKGQLDNLREAWTQITHSPPGDHRPIGEFKAIWQDRIANMRDAIVGAHTAAQAATSDVPVLQAETSVYAPPMALDQSAGTDAAAGSTSSAGAAETETAQSTASGSSKSSDGSEWSQERVEGMITKMHNDPEAYMSELESIEDPKMQQQVMNMVMQQLQQMNRMFSMMSNMQKAMHDTAKAAINNMRV